LSLDEHEPALGKQDSLSCQAAVFLCGQPNV
jgi:hypothetical protein